MHADSSGARCNGLAAMAGRCRQTIHDRRTSADEVPVPPACLRAGRLRGCLPVAALMLTLFVPANVTRVRLFVWNANADALFLDDVTLAREGDTGATDAVTGDPGGAPTAAVASTVNSLDTVINDMALMNDLPLVGVNPAYGFARGPGYNIMGNNPSGSGLPTWYRSAYPRLANTGYWKGILPWFVLFHGQGNGAGNTRVQMRQLKMYVLSRRSNQWQLLTDVNDVSGEFCPQGSNYNACLGGDSKRHDSDGGISIKPRWGQDFHGWYGDPRAIDGWDVKAVFVTMQARLTVDNPLQADDRWRARYLFDVGADYYPEMATSAVYLPGVGVSRAKLITPDWQSFNFITLSDVGRQEPGGGITRRELRENPPPLD